MNEIKQKDLAKALGIHRTYLNGILKGKRQPGVKLAKRITDMTGKNFFDMRPDLRSLIKEYL